MRSFWLATAILAATVSTASAQGRSMKDNAPEPAQWSGFHVGVQGGGAWADWHLDNLVSTPAVGPFTSPGFPVGGFDDSGFVGGVNIGVSIQTGSLVFGIEADFNWSNVEASGDFVAVGISPGLPLNITNTLDHYGTVRGRVGMTWDGMLLYATGGLAWGTSKTAITSPGQFAGPFATSDSSRHTGWTAGGGAEFMIAPNVIVGVEYKHIDLGSKDVAFDFPLATVVNSSVDITIDEVTARLKYKF